MYQRISDQVDFYRSIRKIILKLINGSDIFWGPQSGHCIIRTKEVGTISFIGKAITTRSIICFFVNG